MKGLHIIKLLNQHDVFAKFNFTVKIHCAGELNNIYLIQMF